MAGFHTKTFITHDDYMTPKSAWHNIRKLIPKDKIIWEPFYGDGKSGKYLKDLGFKVYHRKKDFFTYDVKNSVCVTNPPFSKCKEILEKLKNDERPFIMIMPSAKIHTQYLRQLFYDNDDPIQIIIPRKRIHFKKMVDGVVDENQKKACNFDCFYYCWKINLERNITWLSDEDCVELKQKTKNIISI